MGPHRSRAARVTAATGDVARAHSDARRSRTRRSILEFSSRFFKRLGVETAARVYDDRALEGFVRVRGLERALFFQSFRKDRFPKSWENSLGYFFEADTINSVVRVAGANHPELLARTHSARSRRRGYRATLCERTRRRTRSPKRRGSRRPREREREGTYDTLCV